jgi:hypothetical protein
MKSQLALGGPESGAPQACLVVFQLPLRHYDSIATMKLKLTTGNGEIEIDKIPDTCPQCHHGIGPRYMEVAHAGVPPAERFAEVVFRCPRESCQHLFLARYYDRYGYKGYDLIECLPANLRGYLFSDVLQKVSPSFCEIFDQAFLLA